MAGGRMAKAEQKIVREVIAELIEKNREAITKEAQQRINNAREVAKKTLR